MTARSIPALAITFALLLGLGYAHAQEAADAPAIAETAGAAGPAVLRGSGMPPPVEDPATMHPGRWRVAAGDELWLVEPAAGLAVACALRKTSSVGVRVISCETGKLPRVVGD